MGWSACKRVAPAATIFVCLIVQLHATAAVRLPIGRTLKAVTPAPINPPATAQPAALPTGGPDPATVAKQAAADMADLKAASARASTVFQAAAIQVKEPNYTSPFPTLTGAAGTEISSSVSVFYHEDWDVKYLGEGADYGADFTSRCVEMVVKAADSKAKVVNFVITHYWADTNFDGTVDYYCSKLKYGYNCQKMNRLAIDRFRFGMTACFAKAVEMGLSIAITPHLDDGLEMGGWRNALTFDPLVPYSGYSWWDIMLKPLGQALNAVVTNTTQVWFAMQGEMSATIVRYPRSYTAIIPQLKDEILRGRPDADELRQNILVGVSTNFNKICACVLMDLVDPSQYLVQLPAAMRKVIHQFNVTAIKELYETVDLIGISAYSGLKADFKQADLENAIWQFDQEIKEFGVDLKDLIHNKGKAFVLSEFGVGGGIAQNGSVPARTAAEAGIYPFFGIWGVYDVKTDPWQTWQAESVNVPTRTWRRMFYKQTSRWMIANGGPEYRVDGLYLWSLASWDVQAIHYASYDNQGRSYRDWVVADRIRAHNMYINS